MLFSPPVTKYGSVASETFCLVIEPLTRCGFYRFCTSFHADCSDFHNVKSTCFTRIRMIMESDPPEECP